MQSTIRLERAPRYRWWILVINSLAYLHFFGSNQVIYALNSTIKEAWQLSATQLSLLTAMCLLSFSLSALFSGAFVSRIGNKKTVIIGLVLNVLISLLYPVFGVNYISLMVLRFIQGCSGGLIAGSAVSTTALWFPLHQRGLASGVLIGSLGIGSSLVTFCVPRLVLTGMSWQLAAGLFLAIPGAVIAVLYICTVKDIDKVYPGANSVAELLPPEQSSVPQSEEDDQKPRTMKQATKTMVFWAVVLQNFIWGALIYGFSAYAANLLTNDFSMDVITTSTIVSASFFVSLVASPLGGIISDKLLKGKRSPYLIFGSIGLIAIYLIIPAVAGHAIIGAVLLMCSYFLLTSTSGPFWSLPSEVVHPAIASECASMVTVTGNIGGVLAGPVLSMATDLTGNSFSCLFICAGLAGVGLILSFFIKR